MLLLSAKGIEKSYADRAILRGVDLAVDEGERVGLVGPNGCGKSTLLRLLAGEEGVDHGTISTRGVVAMLSQIPNLPGATVGEALDEAVAWHARLLHDYEAAISSGEDQLASQLHDKLDRDGWTIDHRVDSVAQRLGLPDRAARVDRLSGGEARRVGLARVLLQQPDLLVLDEPTNHLDADTCEWLQGLLSGWRGAILLVTHDRYLLEAVATRIVEIEDGIGVGYEGSYTDYLISRAERQVRLHLSEDRRLAMISREAEWASRSPAARSTKQKARLQRLEALQSARPLKREEVFSLDLRTGFKKGGALLELHGIHKQLGHRQILAGVDLILMPGERVGVLGPNGAGKSTLLGILSGRLTPDKGDIRRAPRLDAALLDQERSGLHPSWTVWEAAGGGNDQVVVGERPVHVASFLQRFLFPKPMHDQRVDRLSGGERARLLMARLLLRGANLLLLDEPTNDLDLLTLGVLEEALLAFDGAAVVVTHDRAFLDRVCDRVIVLEGDGQLQPFASRLQHLAAVQARESAPVKEVRAPAPAPVAAAPRLQSTRLSFREKREHEELPAKIAKLEAEQAALHEQLADPGVYQGGGGAAKELNSRLEELNRQLASAWDRWAELEERAG
jgi:ABC transport system ATP-binding/permease protein